MCRRLLFVSALLISISAFSQFTLTLNRSVSSSTDDAEEYVPGGTGTVGFMYLNSSDLEITNDGTIKQWIGIRFNNITIPQGATIISAYIQFTTKGDKAAVAGNAIIKGQDADNAGTFTSTDFNLTSRATTIQSVTWPGSTSATWGTTGGGTRGPDQKTPDLKTVLQAIVNRGGWLSGNSAGFIINGDGVRNAYAWDGNASYAPELIVQYNSATNPPMPIINFPIPKNSSWYFLDNGTDQGTAWKDPSFDHSTWLYGPGKLGYSDAPATTLGYGPNSGNKFITYYFRKKFTVPSLAALSDSLNLNLLRDDGAVVYVNGVEVVRSNMPVGAINYLTFSSAIVDGSDESTYFPYRISKNVLVAGENTIAVEIHQRDGTSSDLGFDLELKNETVPQLIRGPYLQVATDTSIHIRWRTDAPDKSRVQWGMAEGNLNNIKEDAAMVTEHELVITGLSPHTKYWYGIGNLTTTYQGNADNYFMTLPVKGSKDLVRIGVIGDCGNNSTNQIAVRNQLQNYLGSNYMDSWILLGDNAYSNGTDAEFQAEFFNIYKDRFLKQNPLFPCPGNHDYNNGSSAAQNDHAVPYYNIFSMPTAGEAGGVPSNNKAFYSFDVGGVHFLSLDSYGKEGNATRLYDTTGVQVQWIKQDLAANQGKKWIVAYWHHPPFTKGSHDSDTEGELVNIRNNFIRILERYGVDLILCGHSHDYERSRLQKGHYGPEASFDAAIHDLSLSSGLYDGSSNSCPYVKDATNSGTVYVVSGSAGQLGGTTSGYPHNAMQYSNATNGGSMILEVEDNRLDAKWVCADGVIRDRFTIMKDVNTRKVYTIVSGDSVTLTSSFIGSYNWTPGPATTRSIKVSPSDTTTYYAADQYNCLKDTFMVRVLSNSPLPVAWGTVKAWYNKPEQQVYINWETMQEVDTHHFEVERSTDGINFLAIGTVAAAGTSSSVRTYLFTDAGVNTNSHIYYYRIRQVDINGGTKQSPVVTVSLSMVSNRIGVQVLPNPARPNKMQIRLLNNTATVPANIQIADATGKVISSRKIVLNNALQSFMPEVRAGVYFITVTTDTDRSVLRIVVQ